MAYVMTLTKKDCKEIRKWLLKDIVSWHDGRIVKIRFNTLRKAYKSIGITDIGRKHTDIQLARFKAIRNVKQCFSRHT